MKQDTEDGVSAVLLSVVEDMSQAIQRKVSGAELLYDLLSAPWLQALLKIYESLLTFQRLKPSPILPYASGLSQEIMVAMETVQSPSVEVEELYSLLSSVHVQALLSSHDSIAQVDYSPILPPLPDDMPDDEEAFRIVCLVKNNQPLIGNDHRRGHVIPAEGAWPWEELRATETKDKQLSLPADKSRPLVPYYDFTAPWKRDLNQSASSRLTCTDRSKGEAGSPSGSSHTDDYAHPPPPICAVYSLSLPTSPILYKRGAIWSHSRNVHTTDRTQFFTGVRGSNQQGGHLPPGPASNCLGSTEKGLAVCGYQQHPAGELRSTIQMLPKGVDRGPQDAPQCSQKIVAATVTDSRNDRAINLLDEVVDKLQNFTVSNKPLSSPPQRLKRKIPLRNSTVSPKVPHKHPTTYPCPISSSSSSSVSSSEENFSSPNQTKVASLYVAHRMFGCRRNYGSTVGAPLEDQEDCCSTSRRKSNNQ
ncbi:MAGUK p55 subfamily member 4 [Takifugu flavidus]|uniref:MAGUK p55 subfamily member 4 n=1 Tax=Takifugu flavidus TaxID=433684 RepID=A0A5C6PPC4_9TELE|nr:MAGUK p55 subfamily member 4 [Takifugu flavidus]